MTCLPLADAAKGAAVSGALVAACCALFIFHASAGDIRALRAMTGVRTPTFPGAWR